MLQRVRQTRQALADNLENFRTLRKSDYWQLLPEETKLRILILIGEHRESYLKKQGIAELEVTGSSAT